MPQVEEYEKEDDELRKNTMAKLLAVRDNNEFGQQRIRRSSSTYTEVISRGRFEIIKLKVYKCPNLLLACTQNRSKKTRPNRQNP